VAPDRPRRLHPNDVVRVIRALELARAGVRTAGGWRRAGDEYDVLYVGLTAERAALARRLRERAAAMVVAGLLDEVRGLLAAGWDPTLPAMQGIGYREFAAVVTGALSPGEALRRMQRDTVRYAKRQWTWFAREPEIQWLDIGLAGGPEGAAAIIAERARAGGFTG
jgi:tRNA dimethylallyltransferase